MKNLRLAAVGLFTAGILASCQIQYLQVTDNPIGSKTGKAVAKPFQKDANYTFKKAAENGSISKIGSATFTYTTYGIFFKITTEVTGE